VERSDALGIIEKELSKPALAGDRIFRPLKWARELIKNLTQGSARRARFTLG